MSLNLYSHRTGGHPTTQIPSTAHVREVYATQHGAALEEEHRREFDRWLDDIRSRTTDERDLLPRTSRKAPPPSRTVSDAEVCLAVRRACERVALTGSVVEELVTGVEAATAYIDEDGPIGARPTSKAVVEADRAMTSALEAAARW